MHPRELAWDGCVNVRDLGGLPTEDGRETRFGAIVRADSVRLLSEAGWAALVAYGVRTIVDLRSRHEIAADPPAEVPVRVVHVSVVPEDSDPVWSTIGALAETAQRYLAFLDWGEQRFAEAVSAVGEAPEGAVVIHCAGGKDRTGLLAALCLRLGGVGISAIAADYALSERYLSSILKRWVAEAPDEAEREFRIRASTTPAAAMETVLRELERRHSSAEAYLRGLGVSEDALASVRSRLVG